MPHRYSLRALLVLLLLATFAQGSEKLKGIACRSVHLAYSAPASVAFYNEVIVDQSAEGTYFCVTGWDKGYFGIQEQNKGKKVAIFSVWDSSSNDKNAQPEDKRVQLLHQGEGVRIGRFGGEGSGGQSFLDLDWKPGTTYRFMVTARPAGDRTQYSGFIFLPEQNAWKHMVTFSTITGGKLLKGHYSFVEDFKRNRVSTTLVRSARFGPAWVQTAKGDWQRISQASFTADSNPVENINAGVKDGRFFLATGGETANTDVKLHEMINLPAGEEKPPADLPEVPQLPAK